MRTLGRPSGSTVASATAFGSFGSLCLASASQSAQSLNGWEDSVKASLAFVSLDFQQPVGNLWGILPKNPRSRSLRGASSITAVLSIALPGCVVAGPAWLYLTHNFL